MLIASQLVHFPLSFFDFLPVEVLLPSISDQLTVALVNTYFFIAETGTDDSNGWHVLLKPLCSKHTLLFLLFLLA